MPAVQAGPKPCLVGQVPVPSVRAGAIASCGWKAGSLAGSKAVTRRPLLRPDG